MDTQPHPQIIRSNARCIGVRSGAAALPGGTVPLPVLELEFQVNGTDTVTRRFLLDQRHPETPRAFLERFLGHPIRLWELDPETLLGRRGPIEVPGSAALRSAAKKPVRGNSRTGIDERRNLWPRKKPALP